jgi:hypothetical protein
MIKNFQKEKGVSLFLALMVMSLLFSVTLGVSSILISQARVFRIMQGSVTAFYAAETGIEQTLYLDKVCWDNEGNCPSFCLPLGADPCPGLTDDYELPNVDFPDAILDNGASYKTIYTVWGDGSRTIKSIGLYKDVTRAIEATLP